MFLFQTLVGRLLQRGQLVLTGSPLPLYRVTDGERWPYFETDVTMIGRR